MGSVQTRIHFDNDDHLLLQTIADHWGISVPEAVGRLVVPAIREMGATVKRLLAAEEWASLNTPEVTHQCPPDGSGTMPCCGLTPFDVPRYHRMATDPALVTCAASNAPSSPTYCPLVGGIPDEHCPHYLHGGPCCHCSDWRP